MPAGTDRPPAAIHGRAIAVLVVFALLAGMLSLKPVHDWVQGALAWMAAIATTHPVLGPALFVLLAAMSAMLAFFSSAAVVPAAVFAWGRPATAGLLWLGWWLGGVVTYAIGRRLRAPLADTLDRFPAIEKHLPRLPRRLGWPAVLLMQLALPSEVPGYVCGAIRVPFPIYASALALAELPYAVGAVLAGDSILQGHSMWLIGLGAAAALSMAVAYRLLHRSLRRGAP